MVGCSMCRPWPTFFIAGKDFIGSCLRPEETPDLLCLKWLEIVFFYTNIEQNWVIPSKYYLCSTFLPKTFGFLISSILHLKFMYSHIVDIFFKQHLFEVIEIFTDFIQTVTYEFFLHFCPHFFLDYDKSEILIVLLHFSHPWRCAEDKVDFAL